MRRKIGILLIIFSIGLGVATITKAVYYSPEAEIEQHPLLPDAGARAEETLPADIIIPKLDVDTDVQLVGITKSGLMGVPTNFTDTGWYKYGTVPGEEGSAVIDGHETDGLSRSAIFGRLNELEIGDDIYVVREDGKRLNFKVIKKEIVPYNLDGQKLENIFHSKGGRYLNLITCNGNWLQEAKTNDKRVVVYTELVE